MHLDPNGWKREKRFVRMVYPPDVGLGEDPAEWPAGIMVKPIPNHDPGGAFVKVHGRTVATSEVPIGQTEYVCPAGEDEDGWSLKYVLIVNELHPSLGADRYARVMNDRDERQKHG